MYKSHVVQQSVHGCVGNKPQGWKVRIGIACVSALCLTSVLVPRQASAAQTPVTHLQYIQMLSQALGESGQFNAGSSTADYIQWARNKGLNPASGWSASTPVSAQVVAETWVQLLGLNPNKYGRDYFRNLDSQGIHIDPNAVVSHTYLASLLDQPEAYSQLGRMAMMTVSPTKPGNGVGFGLGWYKHRGLTPPALPPGPPPGAGSHGNGHGNGNGPRN